MGRSHDRRVRRGATLAGLMIALCASAQAQTNAAPWPAQSGWTLGAEALAMWQKKSPTPTPIIVDGALGQPRTSVLLGGGDVDTNPAPGLRVFGSYGLDAWRVLDASFFVIDRRSTRRSVDSSGQSGSTNLLLPYFDVIAKREKTTEISLAGQYRGTAADELSNRLMGAEVNASWPSAFGSQQLVLFGGLRWLQLDERYSIATSSPDIPPQPADVWTTADAFHAQNDFYGAQLGVRAQYEQNGWYVRGSGALALGAMAQSVDISGSLQTNDFTGLGATRTYEGGYFALSSNIGNYRRTRFAAVPELALSGGYAITPDVRIFACYRVLYASDVVRPGAQLNRNINTRQSVAYTGEPEVDRSGPGQPSFAFETSSYWAQSLSLGIEFRF